MRLNIYISTIANGFLMLVREGTGGADPEEIYFDSTESLLRGLTTHAREALAGATQPHEQPDPGNQLARQPTPGVTEEIANQPGLNDEVLRDALASGVGVARGGERVPLEEFYNAAEPEPMIRDEPVMKTDGFGARIPLEAEDFRHGSLAERLAPGGDLHAENGSPQE